MSKFFNFLVSALCCDYSNVTSLAVCFHMVLYSFLQSSLNAWVLFNLDFGCVEFKADYT